MKKFLPAISFCLLAGVAIARAASLSETRDIEERFKALRPAESELAIFGLDWEADLAAAKARAAKERRPIFLIVVRNSYGNMFSGHC
ncbi:MAG TPA: hypothetical protein VI454_04175 [Verrucomicrobiae bacterium]|jgi:hypothetical protein